MHHDPTSTQAPRQDRAPKIDRAGGTKQACRFCGSTRLHLVKCDPPHDSRLDCLDCGRRGSPLPSPWNLERARSFKLPFGKHAGLKVGELADSEDGRSYLTWAAQNIEGNVGTAARIALGTLNPGEVAS